MALALEDIEKVPGENNDGGLGVYMYYALLQDILTFPKVAPAPTDYAASVTVSADFVMKTGKKFYKFQNTLEKSSLQTTSAGERDGRSAENMYNFQHPGNKPQAVAWLEQNKNSDLVCIVEDVATGFKRILGSEFLPASFESFEVTSGDAVSSEKVVRGSIKSVGRVAPFYTGTIPLTAAI